MSSKKIMKKIIPSIKKGPKHKQQQQHRPPSLWWQWRPPYSSSCNHHHPQTLDDNHNHNHDAANNNNNNNNIIFKTTHNSSIFLHPAYLQDHHLSVPDFCLTLTSDDIENHNNNTADIVSSSSSSSSSLSVETIIRGAVKTSDRDRLFFEPEPGRTSSILLPKEEEEEEKEEVDEQEEEEDLAVAPPLPFKESVALALESEDPYRDFKESMREMVESQGLKNYKEGQEEQGGWESLEELLGWYLRMNNRMNHGIIVGAFVDLLLGLAKAADDDHHHNNYNNNNNNNIIRTRRSSSSTSSTSPSSSYSSADSCFSSPRSVVTGEEDQAHDIQ